MVSEALTLDCNRSTCPTLALRALDRPSSGGFAISALVRLLLLFSGSVTSGRSLPADAAGAHRRHARLMPPCGALDAKRRCLARVRRLLRLGLAVDGSRAPFACFALERETASRLPYALRTLDLLRGGRARGFAFLIPLRTLVVGFLLLCVALGGIGTIRTGCSRRRDAASCLMLALSTLDFDGRIGGSVVCLLRGGFGCGCGLSLVARYPSFCSRGACLAPSSSALNHASGGIALRASDLRHIGERGRFLLDSGGIVLRGAILERLSPLRHSVAGLAAPRCALDGGRCLHPLSLELLGLQHLLGIAGLGRRGKLIRNSGRGTCIAGSTSATTSEA